MAGPPSQPLPEGSANKAAAEEKEKTGMSEWSIQQAMMDDLGLARLEELPLEDDKHDRDHRRHHPGGGFELRDRRPRDRVTLDPRWSNAISSGTFKDEDAAAVEGLSDLGGGRLYETAQSQKQPLNRKEAAKNQTKSLLSRSNEKFTRQPANQGQLPNDTIQSNKRKRVSDQYNGPRARPNFLSEINKAMSRPAVLTPLSRPNQRTAKFNNTQVAASSRPALVSAPAPAIPPPDPAIPLPGPVIPVGENASPSGLAFELENVIFKATITFLSRDINPAIPAMVFLSAAPAPMLGWFRIVAYSQVYRQWPISAWQDYTSGDTLQLGVFFMDSTSVSQGYELFFKEKEQMVEFLNSVHSLRESEKKGIATLKSPGAAAPVAHPGPVAAQSPKPTEHLMLLAAPEVQQPNIAAGYPNVPAVNEAAAAVAASTMTKPPSPLISAVKIDHASDEEHGKTPIGTLIDLEADGAVSAPSQAPSEAMEILSTLDLYDDSNDVSSSTSEAQLFQEQIVTTARKILGVFLLSSVGGETMDELSQTVEGIKAGIMEFVAQSAKDRELSVQKQQALEKMVNDVFDSLEVQRLPETDCTNNKQARIQYTVDELLALQPSATTPPAHLTSIQLPLNNPSKSDACPDSGLKTSRWASAGTDFKHESCFTGPAYEKKWPKRSELSELARLDPQKQVTAGTEDLIDYYFPHPEVGMDRGAKLADNPAVASDKGHGAGQSMPELEDVEALRQKISRLSLEPDSSQASIEAVTKSLPSSSANPQATPAVQPAIQPAVRGLGASRHSAALVPASSGQFKFHIPK